MVESHSLLGDDSMKGGLVRGRVIQLPSLESEIYRKTEPLPSKPPIMPWPYHFPVQTQNLVSLAEDKKIGILSRGNEKN